MRKGFYYIVAVLLVSMLWSCSTKKNTRMNRFYHALNSRFNIYFNGKTAFDEALLAMQTGYKENYSDMILMYPISAQPKDKTEPGGPFDISIEKANKAIRLHSIQAKPKKKPGWRNDPKQVRLQNQEEYNPFLKHCWRLMGEAQFYNADFLQAAATFSYIARHYKEDAEIVAASKLWQARCYSELGWFYDAEDILQKLNTEGIPADCQEQYATVYADYLVKQQRYEEAIPYMRTAIRAERSGLQRKRMKYLLGQMYATLGQDAMAYKTFGEVARSNPPYELEFAARIRQAEVFAGSNYQKVVKKLERMAKSQKNKDLLDQIYYALGNIYLAHGDTTNALKQYQLGVDKSTQNGLDKALCHIKLGDLYFQQRDYLKAQPNFSAALAGIQKEFKDYERVSKLSAVLDELVVHAEAVHLQDSLQTLAKMPEQERLAVIDKIIERVIEEEKRAEEEAAREAYLAEQAAKGTGINRPGTEANVVTLPVAGGGSSFYFYNPQAVAQGKTQFQRKWGRRPLEDDWRRRNKRVSTFDEPSDDSEALAEGDDLTAAGDSALLAAGGADSAAIGSDDPKSREYYLQQLPMTPEDVEASNVIIEDGLYNMAKIYKDKLEDLSLAIEGFRNLEKRFPESPHLLESYYQVYLMALRLKDTALAEEYKRKMTEKFPSSDYTVAISDPNFERNIRMMDVVQDSIYEQTYELYLAEDTAAVRRNYRAISEKYPLAELMPKFMFLDALTYVQAGDAEGFKTALRALLDKYPSADVSELAGEMLKGVLRGRQMVQGGVRGMTWNLRFGTGEDGSLSAADSARVFKADANVPYRMVMIYPTGAIDRNQLLFTVAAYNFAHFMVKQLDMTFEESGLMSVFILSGFFNFDEVNHYYKMIYDADGYAPALDKDIAIVPISEENYETLMHGKTLDEYAAFFEANFGQMAPEFVARWRMRQEAAAEADSLATDSIPSDTLAPMPAVPEELPLEEADSLAADSVQLEIPAEMPVAPEGLPLEEADSSRTAAPVLPTPADTLPARPDIFRAPIPERDKGLTLDDIEEIRQKEAEQAEAEKEKARQDFEASQAAEKAVLEQNASQRAALEEQQRAEERALLEAKKDREKEQEKAQKEARKKAEQERKAKLKAREELRKEKERAYKERLKQKEKERKAKEKAYKKKLKEREKARKEELKAKERVRKEKEKNR